MKSATHSGTCQVCGHGQKLPGNLLSKHGYTVRWGFFSGTCFGSDNQPFELDISLIKGAIEDAKRIAASNRAKAKARTISTDANDVHCSVYPRHGYWGKHETGVKRFQGRVERRPFMVNGKQLVVDGRKYWDIFFVATDNAGEPMKHNDQIIENKLDKSDVAEAVKDLNRQEAWRLEQIAKQADQYVEWQQKRISGWKPQPEKLVPVVAERKGPLVHWAGGYWNVGCSSSAYGAQKIWNKTADASKVTCAKCLKRHAEIEALEPVAKAAFLARCHKS